MLNTRREEQNTGCYPYLACFVNKFNLEYVRFHVIYRVSQADYAIRTPMAAPQEYMNTYSTRRITSTRAHTQGIDPSNFMHMNKETKPQHRRTRKPYSTSN